MNDSRAEPRRLPPDFEEVDGVLFYRGARPLDELPFPEAPGGAEFEWALTDREVRREHGGRVVAVRGRKVWGVGKTYRAAWEAACQDPACPPRGELVFVAVPALPPDGAPRGGSHGA
jgi:hypothetical protein